MIYPPFVPKLSPGWSYVIKRVISIDGGHLVIYTKRGDGVEEQRVAFVCADPFGDWDLITHTKRVKIERVRLKIKRVRL